LSTSSSTFTKTDTPQKAALFLLTAGVVGGYVLMNKEELGMEAQRPGEVSISDGKSRTTAKVFL